jgi:hypothetical protein
MLDVQHEVLCLLTLKKFCMCASHACGLCSHGSLCVVWRQVPLTRQQLGDLYIMREVVNTSSGHWQAVEAKCDQGKLGPPWASVWTGPHHIIFGHDHQRGLQARAARTERMLVKPCCIFLCPCADSS